MVRIDADTTSLDRFIQLLEKTSTEFVQQRQREMVNKISEDAVSTMQYPPPGESGANVPPPYPFYQRGRGSVSRAGTVLYESGDLKSNWRREMGQSGNSVTARISNTTIGRHRNGSVRSYSSYVHGIPQHPNISLRQALFHTDRNWPSLFLVTQKLVGERGVTVSTVTPSDSPENVAADIVQEIEKF